MSREFFLDIDAFDVYVLIEALREYIYDMESLHSHLDGQTREVYAAKGVLVRLERLQQSHVFPF